MKTSIVIILTFACASVFAQGRFMIGADFGGTFTKDHNTLASPGETSVYQTNLLYGFEADYEFDDTYTVRAQFFPNERGGLARLETYDYTYSIGLSHNDFLDIPVTVKYNAIGTNVKGYIYGGPFLSIHTSGVAVFSNPNFGITAGVGAYRPNQILSYFAEAGYAFGLVNLSREPSIRAFSRDIRINAGLLLTLE
ncbi:MAG: hypothetical protein ABI778_01520 [Ignavibacteriota bacterium]